MNTITYMTGLLTFYLKGEISTDQNFLKLKLPNTILALIPLGAKKDNIPVQQVASVSSNFKLNLKRFLIGILICLFAFCCFSDTIIGGIILLLWGASTVITSFATELHVATTAGIQYIIPFFKKSIYFSLNVHTSSIVWRVVYHNRTVACNTFRSESQAVIHTFRSELQGGGVMKMRENVMKTQTPTKAAR